MEKLPHLTTRFITGIFLLSILSIAGCASTTPTPQNGTQCPANRHDSVVRIDYALLNDLQYVKRDLAEYSGTNPELLIISGDAPNAFAWKDKKRELIAINLGLIQLLGDNLDEYAFVISHEMAHISQGHIDKKKSHNTTAQMAGSVLGLVVEAVGIGLGIPFSGLLSSATVSSGTHLVAMSYSRDQEIEADELGLGYMQKAGFSPMGAIHFQQKLQHVSENNIAFLSTHPQTEERIENLKRLILEGATE